jgi:hypothetical protein
LKEYIAVNNEYLEVKGREEKTKVRLLFSIDEMIIYRRNDRSLSMSPRSRTS